MFDICRSGEVYSLHCLQAELVCHAVSPLASMLVTTNYVHTEAEPFQPVDHQVELAVIKIW